MFRSPPLRFPTARRRFWLLAAFLVLAVQLGLPAHEDSHPLGQLDNSCHICMLGGHMSGMPSAWVVPPPLPQYPSPARHAPLAPPASDFPRTRFSRGPPAAVNA